MPRALMFLAVCVAATPAVIYGTAAATAFWFEHWYLPHSNAEDD